MEQDLKYVYAVYKNESFSKAAKTLFITQPALSIAIQKVEDKIGMALFDRSKKPLTLTEAGKLFIKKIVQIQSLEDELNEQVNDISGLKNGTLKIGGTHYFNAYVLPAVITEFKKLHPGINLSLIESSSWHLLDMLSDHEIEITFNCEPKPKDSFIRTPGFLDTILVSVPRSFGIEKNLNEYALSAEDIKNGKHKNKNTKPVDLQLLRNIPFILLSQGNNLYKRSQFFFAEAGFTPNVCLQVNQLVTAYHLSCAGLGATFISDLLVSSSEDRAIFFTLDSIHSKRVFDIVMSDTRYVSKAMKEFERIFHSFYSEFCMIF